MIPAIVGVAITDLISEAASIGSALARGAIEATAAHRAVLTAQDKYRKQMDGLASAFGGNDATADAAAAKLPGGTHA